MKDIEFVALPSFNISAVFAVGSFPSISDVEGILKILVLAATLVYTVVRTVQVTKNKKQNSKEKEE